jgi:hypothetical protein
MKIYLFCFSLSSCLDGKCFGLTPQNLGFGIGLCFHDQPIPIRFRDLLESVFFGLGRSPNRRVQLSLASLDFLLLISKKKKFKSCF